MVTALTPAVQDFDVAVALGVISNTNNQPYDSFVKFGRNPAIGTGWEGIRISGGKFVFPTQAGKVFVRAGGAPGDIDGGSGAHNVRITGIDSDFEIRSEVIPLNGVLQSADSAFDYWRVYTVQVVNSGTYGEANIGDILLDVSNTTKSIGILADEGQSQYGSVSIPKEHSAIFRILTIVIEGKKNVNVRVFARSEFNNTVSPVRSKNIVRSFSQLPEGSHTFPFIVPEVSDQLTDIWVEAQTATGTSSVSVNAGVLLVPNR